MLRIGEGYDVHKFCDEKDLVLGGVNIPYSMGLLGHSDADVLLHAIIDALFGAFSLYDIGKHFPDSDHMYKGISSLELLKKTITIITEDCKNKNLKFVINNIDSIIVCQEPKLRPYIDDMIKNISVCLNIASDRVNVKATTEEGLGFTGRKEGIAAKAICLVDILKE